MKNTLRKENEICKMGKNITWDNSVGPTATEVSEVGHTSQDKGLSHFLLFIFIFYFFLSLILISHR